jgi:two-component system, NarL family, response regulator DegU
MPAEIRVFIADDHPIFRQGLKLIVEKDSQLKVVGEADDGEAALEDLKRSGAQIAILDVDMPNKDGFEVVREMRRQRMRAEVVFLTMHKDERFLNAALDLGVKGYVLKDSAVTEIVNCIRSVAAGRDYVSPQLSSFLINRQRHGTELAGAKPQLEQLSPTERRVLKLIGQYKTSKEIAGELLISVRTVEHHRANISEKLELKGSHVLLKFAVEHQSEI